MIKRLGVFCTYDSEGVVDDYIIFLLQDMIKNLSHLAIVCNGKLTPEGRRKLEKITADIFVTEKAASDMEAWQQGILQKNLADYDELILFNDSFYGPFYPFAEIFDKMDAEKPDADFWAVTIHGQNQRAENFIPEYLQLYFLVVRKKMLQSPEFFNYWKNWEPTENIDESKIYFTKKFFDAGFTYAAYCDTRAREKLYKKNIDHCIMSAEILLKNYNCPVIKKKVFLTPRADYMEENYGDEPRKTLTFIKENTNYDFNLIWKNLLRTQNIADIKSTFALNYIFSNKKSQFDDKNILKDTAIIAHLYYEDLISECTAFLLNAPPEISIFVTVNSEEKKLLVESKFKSANRKVEVRIVSNRGRDFSALLVGCADIFGNFKYLCFVHDKKSLRENESLAVGREFFHLLWKNTLNSENYIKNILAAFEKEPRLGILTPPHPYNGGYKILLFLSKYWSGECYNSTVELAKNLGIPQELINSEHLPLAIGSVFWCRTEAIKKITAKNWKVEDFPEEPMPNDGTISHALERIFPFAAQAEGFYTGWLMTENFAREELENFIHFSNQSVTQLSNIVENNSVLPDPQTLFEYFSMLTTIQCLKYFFQSRIPPKYWFFFKPFKIFLGNLGFKV